MATRLTGLTARVGSVSTGAQDGKAIIGEHRSGELWFAVVGPVGAGGSRAVASLVRACEDRGYVCEWIKASDLIRTWAETNGRQVPPSGVKTLEIVHSLQNLGDEMRTADPTAVARAALAKIAEIRAERTGQVFVKGQAVAPDNVKRAYLIDSIRHPAETMLFRRTYANSFALVGVVCEEEKRKRRIIDKYLSGAAQRDPGLMDQARRFIERDADDEAIAHGQHVTEAFHGADFFIDNSSDDPNDAQQLLDEPLGRLVSIVAHDRMIRPTMDETAMHHAHSARVRSACLSRQVGAALVDADGTVVATGTNEVPRAGGGVYGELGRRSGNEDHRCAFREEAFCSSNREQNKIIEDLIDSVPALAELPDRKALARTIRRTRVGQLIEFSRAVHAEMDALLSAGREGVSTVGTRLFVTTFPCHYCARHVVSAGVYEVQFIEPYPKSLALALHKDAITVEEKNWQPPEEVSMAEERRMGEREAEKAMDRDRRQDDRVEESDASSGKVLFRSFVGVAPRLYLRAFEKTRPLKNKETGNMEIGSPAWGDDWSPMTAAYPELEAALTRTQ